MTDQIISRGDPGDAGAINVTSRGGSISTGSLDASSTSSSGGPITLTANGTITTDSIQMGSGIASVPGASGSLTINTPDTVNISNGISSRGANITIGNQTAPNAVLLPNEIDTQGGNFSLASSGPLAIASSISTSGGGISISGTTLNVSSRLNSGNFNSSDAQGGPIALNAQGDITISGPITSAASLQGGTISLTSSSGDISVTRPLTTGELSKQDSETDFVNRSTQKGGDITLQANRITTNSLVSQGAIRGGDVRLTSGDSINMGSITTGGPGSGGNLTLRAARSITTQAIDTSGNSGSGGTVTLDPSGDVQVSFINAQGSSGGPGGNVDITTESLFRATSSFTDQNGIRASISTADGLGGGAITIRHGGGLLGIPFVVGDASINGTTGAVTSGIANQITPVRSFRTSFTQGTPPGQIQIITSSISNIDQDIQPRLPERQPYPSTTQPIPTIALAPDFEAIEAKLTDQFTAHLELPNQPPLVTLPEAQEALQSIESKTGVKPALIYVNFVPALVKTASAHGSSDADTLDNSQLELLLVTATGNPILKWVPDTSRAEVLRTASQFRYEVADPSKTRTQSYLPYAQQLYRWLIAPLEETLKERHIQNLVFVMDSGLRFMPIAALHDGQSFLVERYSIGLMPTLSLTDTRYAEIKTAQVLAAGASTFTDQNPLPAVPVELANIRVDQWQGQQLLMRPLP